MIKKSQMNFLGHKFSDYSGVEKMTDFLLQITGDELENYWEQYLMRIS